MHQFDHWMLTSHAGAYDNHPELQNDETCLPCHTTGWDVALNNGGFDDFFFIGDTTGMASMRNVQCEVCHGPTEEPHTGSTFIDHHAELCGQCHNQENSYYYDEWSQSLHNHSASEQELECARCHEAASAAVFLSTGEHPSGLPADPVWEITCSVCHTSHDPEINDYQLRQWPAERTCRTCHTMEEAVVGEEPHSPQEEMLNGPGNGAYEWPGFFYNNSCHWMYLPEPCVMCHQYPEVYGNPDTTTTGHSLEPDILFCASSGCHMEQIPPDSSFDIGGIFAEMDSLTFRLDSLLGCADTTQIEYDQALFDYLFVVNDGSRGIHNYFYARDLLISSIEGIMDILPVDNESPAASTPNQFVLHPPHPNPFNPETVFSFELRTASLVKFEVYNVSGRQIADLIDGQRDAGRHEVLFDGTNLPSGVYIYRMTAGVNSATGKMVLLK
jgi:hypothetical protein